MIPSFLFGKTTMSGESTPKDHVFLSYAREDGGFALELAEKLKSRGVALWIDQLDIGAGVRWDRETESALRQSPTVLAILSPAAVTSENVLDEIGFALDEGKKVVPVLCERCEIPIRLRRLQYLDLSAGETHLEELVLRLQEIGGESPAGEVAATLPGPTGDEERRAPEPPPASPSRRAVTRARRPLLLGAVAVLALAAGAVYWTRSSPSPDKDEILRGFRQAMGGEAAWGAISSAVLHGSIAVTGAEPPLTITFRKPSSLRIEVGTGPSRSIQAFDGVTAWTLLPGGSEPELLPPWAGAHLLAALEFETPLIGSEAKGHAVELVGEETVKDQRAFVLRVEHRGGGEQLWYLDAETWLPIKSRGTMLFGGREKVEADIFYRDFREVDGLQIYHEFEALPLDGRPGYRTSISDVELNVPVGPELFAMTSAATPEPTAPPPAPAAKMSGARPEETTPEIRIKPAKSLIGRNIVLYLWNASTPFQELTNIQVEVSAPDGEKRSYTEARLGEGFFSFGKQKLDGWEIRSGSTVRVRCDQYSGTLEYRVP